jgi:hypothetical protein
VKLHVAFDFRRKFTVPRITLKDSANSRHPAPQGAHARASSFGAIGSPLVY